MGIVRMRVSQPFGLKLSTDTACEIASAALRHTPDEGVALVVTWSGTRRPLRLAETL